MRALAGGRPSADRVHSVRRSLGELELQAAVAVASSPTLMELALRAGLLAGYLLRSTAACFSSGRISELKSG